MLDPGTFQAAFQVSSLSSSLRDLPFPSFSTTTDSGFGDVSLPIHTVEYIISFQIHHSHAI